MLGSLFLSYDHAKRHGIFYNVIERCLQAMNHGYESSLLFVLRHRFSTLVVAFGLLGASVWLFLGMPQRLPPQHRQRVYQRYGSGRAGYLV